MKSSSASVVRRIPAPVNEIRLVGRLSGEVVERELPSGDTIEQFRVIVERHGRAREASRQKVDTFDCVVWQGRVKETCLAWRAGDLIEVHGELRRRFYRTGGGSTSRVEVEVARGRVIRRATT